MPKKELKPIDYFYIDETGHIANDQPLFILGCIKTDSPTYLEQELIKKFKEITDSLYFNETLEKIKRDGFHASVNHPDVRSRIMEILPLLNFRSYFVLLNKRDDFFARLKASKQMHEIYELCVRKLLKNTLAKKDNRSIFYFEELEIKGKPQRKVLDSFFAGYSGKWNFEYHITTKKNINLAVIDYMNYTLGTPLSSPEKIQPKMRENFNLIQPKIGLINYINIDKYLDTKIGIDLNMLLKLLDGKPAG